MNNSKRIYLSLALSLTWGCMLSMSAAAESIYYDGTDTSLLKPGTDPQFLALYSQTSHNNNTITVNMGGSSNILDGSVYGGVNIIDRQTVSGNHVQIYNATIAGVVYGGYSDAGNAIGNSVSLNNSTAGVINGGASDAGNAIGNSVSLNNSTAGVINGGASNAGNAIGNSVSINNSAANFVNGGYSDAGNATGNSVSINNSTVQFDIYGGASNNAGNATGNSVSLNNNSTVQFDIYGGASNNAGNATGNSVSLNNNSTVQFDIYGGYSNAGNAAGNSVSLNNNSTVQGDIYGGYSNAGNAAGNSVSINNSTVQRFIYGGQSVGGNATGNSVSLNNSTVQGSVNGGVSVGGNANATGNSVSLNNSTADAVNGGISFGNATGNSVSINNSTVQQVIYGGASVGGNATGNMVRVSGSNNLASATISGGYSIAPNADVFSGNILEWASVGTVKKIANFEYYNFIVPAGVDPITTPLLSITESLDLANVKVKLTRINGERKWQVGEKLVLLSSGGGLTNAGLLNGHALQGIRRYDYALSQTNNDINAEIVAAGASEQAKSLSEGRIAAIGFINSAVDMATGSGLQNAMDSSSGKIDMFGAMNYGDSKYNSGSYADVKGTSMLLGFSRKLNKHSGHLVVGAFIESGNSSYETFNNFTDGDVRAHGKNNYFGGGIIARNVQNSGIYYEGSARIGRMSSDYDSRDIDTKYDTKSTYYGLHLGLGKLLELNKTTQLDVYGKYYWSHQGASRTSIMGDDFNFDAINSHRLRVGARVNLLGGGNGIKTYFGLAYEHEFSGSAAATYMGESIAAPSIKGGTGIGEIGMSYKPSAQSAFSMDVGLNGYMGKRQGIGGGVRFNWGF